MSYRRKRLCALLGSAVILSMTVTACSGTAADSTDTTESQQAVSTGDTLSYDDMFTDRDLDVGYEESDSVKISLSDDSTTVSSGSSDNSSTDDTVDGVTVDGNVITITSGGTYIISGTLTEGQLVVDADDEKVQLVLDNADVTCATSAAIYVKSAGKTFITLAEGSENILMNTAEFEAIDDNNIDAVIFSKDDLALNGSGTLTINSENGHGIVSKDDLKITGGTYNITAASHALSGKDSVRIAEGTFNLVSGKDGIHSENADDSSKGYVYIAGGEFTVDSTGDGIDASNIVQIDGGTFDITAGGGVENSTKTHEDNMMGGPGGGNGPQMGEAPDGNTPSEKPSGEVPQGDPGNNSSENSGSDNSSSDSSSSDIATPPEKPDSNTNQAAGTEQSESDTSDSDSASTKGIKADGRLYINAGTFTINSADDSVHSNSAVTINDGTYTLTTGDDGVHSGEAVEINGGTITISESYEGLEGLTVTINDGDIDITSSDDGINAAGGTEEMGFGGMGNDSTEDTSTDEMWMEINGGYIHVLAGGDGIDSNGDITVNGGEVYIDGPSDNGNSAIDYGDRSACYVNGGTVVAIGSSGMAEDISDDSDQQVMLVKLDSQKEAGEVTLTDSDGNEIITYTALKAYDCVIISTKDLEAGQTYTLTTSGTQTNVDL
ncbi:MAG: carbohydrate-binding domain-containing protein [Agathobacter sp.]|uniref:carbohydrate-binding domain-containing protein n=1 Tax=Agathobacter sp. TaxID=2021311 RepID=UPI003991421D